MNLKNRLNFSGGPGALPATVLAQTQQAIDQVPEVGLSILGISHRSDWFAEVVAETERNILQLLRLPDSYKVLLLQGGATQQFSMIPMSFLRASGKAADYVQSGYWSSKPVEDARREGEARLAWDGSAHGFNRLPTDAELRLNPDAAYLHYVSNETVEGLQFNRVLGLDGVPRICDMSSDLLSKPCQAERFDLIYAHAQKNLGPSGVTIVIARDAFLPKGREDLPAFLDYDSHARAKSNLNTPPVFSIYVVLLCSRWLLSLPHGLDSMQAINERKAALVYSQIDAAPHFYKPRALARDRSIINACFTLPTPELHHHFLAQAGEAGFSGLSGHRSIGGIRASLYNGLEIEAAAELAGFMESFRRKSGI